MLTIDTIIKYPIVFFTGFLVAFFLTPLVRATAIKLSIVDRPGERRLNQVVVARGGGIAVFLGFHVACAVIFLVPWTPFEGNLDLQWWIHFIGVSAFVVFLGFLDDVFDIRPLYKLLGQIAAAVVMFFLNVRVGNALGAELPLVINLALTVLWFVLITNAFNLIDGLDGLATGLASIAAFGLAGALVFQRQPGDVLVLLGLIGSCLAFLRYNFHPASIFLGDCGSMFLGFSLASIALSTSSAGTVLASIGVPLLAVGIPIFDTLLTIWRRSVRKLFPSLRIIFGASGLMQADMEHLHHRLVKSGHTQTRVAVWLYTANVVLVAVGLLSLIYSSHAVGIYLITFVVGTYVVVRHVAHVELWDSGSLILAGLRRPSHPMIAAMAYPAIDFLLLILALASAILLQSPQVIFSELKLNVIESIPIWCGMPFLSLFFIRTYSRVWSRARVSDFSTLVIGLIMGVLLSCGVAVIVEPRSLTNLSFHPLVYYGVALTLVMGIRALPRILQDLMALMHRDSQVDGSSSRAILIYGAGDGAMLYLKQKSLSAHVQRTRVVGLLDDDRQLRKRIVYGYRVLGEFKDLVSLVARYGVTDLIITAPLSSERMSEVLHFAEDLAITVTHWATEEKILLSKHGMPPSETRRVMHSL